MRLIVLLGLAALLPATSLAEGAGRLLLVQEYLERPDTRSGEEWLCVVVERWVVQARKCNILVTDHDEKDGSSGARIEAGIPGEPLFLVKGVPGLQEGPVPTAVAGRVRLSTLTATVEIGGPDAASVGVWGSEGAYEITLFVGDAKQILARTTALDNVNTGLPAVHWAGDLDRDGKLDLLVDVSGHYSGTELKLYLSSQATKGELVHEVASLSKGNC